MKVAIFRVSSSIESASLEDSVNSFLAKLPENAVNHVNTSTSATKNWSGNGPNGNRDRHHNLV